jgi:FAD/FMN-containing dehydrogenase
MMNEAELSSLVAIVGDRNVLTSPGDVAGYVTDWRGRFSGRAGAVVRPGSTSEVSAVMAWATRHRCPVVPQGGNTGMTGGGIPDGSGREVVLALGRMRSVRSLDGIDDTVVVDAGCTLAEIQAAAAAADRLFPLSLGSEGSCQIGGNIATNAGGLEVLRYGTMRDLVLGLEVVLPDGGVLANISTLRKNNTGYDLKQIFIGSEGTLGIVTGAALKLFARPRSAATAFCGLASPDDALEVLARVKADCGPRLSTFEIMNGLQLELILAHTRGPSPLEGGHPWHLLIEATEPAEDAGLADRLMRSLAGCIDAGLLADAAVAQSEAQRQAFWALRHVVSESNNHAGRALSHDTSVPVSRNAQFIRDVEAALAGQDGLQITFVGHLGDGNVHTVAIFDRAKVTAEQFEGRAKPVSDAIYAAATSLGGSISAEHGIGVSLRDRMPRVRAPLELALMRLIKDAFDPLGIMNPGKVLPAPEASASCG